MNQRAIVLAALLALVTTPSLATDLEATTWDEARTLSRQHDKPILIDFFTEW